MPEALVALPVSFYHVTGLALRFSFSFKLVLIQRSIIRVLGNASISYSFILRLYVTDIPLLLPVPVAARSEM